MKLVIVTNNSHKVHEINQTLSLPIPVIAYTDVYERPIDIIEDGMTFEANAMIKVTALPSHPTHIYLAEDSGIEVDYLDGAPGIYSARYAGPHATSTDMCQKLLRECYGAGYRDAQYQAVMALRFPDGNIATFQGIIRGQLSHEILGENGFGYDPIFIPDMHTDTFGQLPPEEKFRLSHRTQALNLVRPAVLDYIQR